MSLGRSSRRLVLPTASFLISSHTNLWRHHPRRERNTLTSSQYVGSTLQGELLHVCTAHSIQGPKIASLMLPGTPCSEIRLALSTKGKGQGTEFSVYPGAVRHVGEEGGAHLVSGVSRGECGGPKQHWKQQLPSLCGLPLPCWTDAFPPRQEPVAAPKNYLRLSGRKQKKFVRS